MNSSRLFTSSNRPQLYHITPEGRDVLKAQWQQIFLTANKYPAINNFFAAKPADTSSGSFLVAVSINPAQMCEAINVLVDAFYVRKLTPAVRIGFVTKAAGENHQCRPGQQIQFIFTQEAELMQEDTIISVLNILASSLENKNIGVDPEPVLTELLARNDADRSLFMQPLSFGADSERIRFHYRRIKINNNKDFFAKFVPEEFMQRKIECELRQQQVELRNIGSKR